jgi:hypothetical protein
MLISNRLVRDKIIDTQTKHLKIFEKTVIEKKLMKYIEQVKS